MDKLSNAPTDHALPAEPWPELTWLHRSEGFAEDLAPPAQAAAQQPARRSDGGMGMVRRLERLTGSFIAASVRPASAVTA